MTSGKKEFAPEMILIPGRSFLMGSEEGQDNEKPVHRVWVDSFMIGKYPVTNKEYALFVSEAGVREPPFWKEPPFSHPDKPVVGVSWYDAVAFCQWLSDRSGKTFRLPTEAEWERAARGSNDGRLFSWGNEPPWEMSYLGHDPESGGPQRVGIEEQNELGLWEMSGGVHEWCSDLYDRLYYKDSPARNPQGPPSGVRRVSRGGSWRHRVKFSRCAARSSLNPSFQYADYGFRLALTAKHSGE